VGGGWWVVGGGWWVVGGGWRQSEDGESGRSEGSVGWWRIMINARMGSGGCVVVTVTVYFLCDVPGSSSGRKSASSLKQTVATVTVSPTPLTCWGVSLRASLFSRV
jgi:hypothetical protein